MKFSNIAFLLLTHNSFVLWYNLSLLLSFVCHTSFSPEAPQFRRPPKCLFYKVCLSSVVHLFMKMSQTLILCFCVVWTVKVGPSGLLCDIKREHIKICHHLQSVRPSFSWDERAWLRWYKSWEQRNTFFCCAPRMWTMSWGQSGYVCKKCNNPL